MRKMTAISIAAIMAVAGLALAGFDMYTAKNYTTLLAPTYVATSDVAITNSTSTGVDVAGLPGAGAVLFMYSTTNGATSVLSFSLYSCATTNGTYVKFTNSAGVSAWAYTNGSGVAKVAFTPNQVSRYMRVVVTPTATTNGVCGAVLVTE